MPQQQKQQHILENGGEVTDDISIKKVIEGHVLSALLDGEFEKLDGIKSISKNTMIHSISYVDDLVIILQNKKELRKIIVGLIKQERRFESKQRKDLLYAMQQRRQINDKFYMLTTYIEKSRIY